MATYTINQNVNTAITDFGMIKQAIVNKGVSVPTGTPTSQYGNKIASIPTGADVSGVTATAADVDTGKVFVDSTGTEVTGSSTYKSDYTALNTIVGQTTATAADVAQGKVFVNSSGVQTTGTASGGNASGLELFYVNNAIPNSAISYAGLSNTVIGTSIVSIGESVFEYSAINSVTFAQPSSLTTISAYAFSACELITTLTLPSTITTIGNYAFGYCTSLEDVTFLGTPTTISTTAFADCDSLITINVPWSDGAVSGAPWGATNATITYNYTP